MYFNVFVNFYRVLLHYILYSLEVWGGNSFWKKSVNAHRGCIYLIKYTGILWNVIRIVFIPTQPVDTTAIRHHLLARVCGGSTADLPRRGKFLKQLSALHHERFSFLNCVRLYLSLKAGVNVMNSQHLRLKWHLRSLIIWPQVFSVAWYLLNVDFGRNFIFYK